MSRNKTKAKRRKQGKNIGKNIICDHCGLGFTEAEYAERHTPHAFECEAVDNPAIDCDCDINIHERCANAYYLANGYYADPFRI